MPFDPKTGRWSPTNMAWQGFSDPVTGSPWASIGTGEPDWIAARTPSASPMGQAFQEYGAARTIPEDWARFQADLPADPRWRRGFEAMFPRQVGRYLLAEPYIGYRQGVEGEPGYMRGEADPDTSFARFLSDIGGTPEYRTADRDALRLRAARAAQAAAMPVSGLGDIAGDPIMQAYYGQFGGGGREAYQRQLAVADMLARQRVGGGQYRGRLGEAIGRTMAAMAATRQARGAPQTSFLNWYLGQTGGIPEVTSAAGPAAAGPAAAASAPPVSLQQALSAAGPAAVAGGPSNLQQALSRGSY